MAKPRVVVSLDCETLSLARNAAVIDIGYVVMIPGGMNSSHRILVNPESYEGSGLNAFTVDADTIDFHRRQNTGLVESATLNGMNWKIAAEKLFIHLSQLADFHELHIWAKGKDFDGPVIENFLKQAGFSASWKYSHLHCLRDLAALFPEVRQKSYGDHTALKDAEAQAAHLMDIAAYSERASNYIFGKSQ